MTLSVIGAGFGRTGTTSLKLALEQLGLGPCYHMHEVFRDPRKAEHWVWAATGAAMDWDTVFAGYRSAVDWPSTDYWRDLMAYAPDAKVILTLRDPERWFESTQSTIFGPANPLMEGDDSALGRMMQAIGARNFGGAIHDRDICIAAFERHNAEVRRAVPADMLLVLEAEEGWEPLCGFLGVPVPDGPFPRANTTSDFRERAAARAANPG